MLDQAVSNGPDSTPLAEPERNTGSTVPSFITSGDVIPIVPNLLATISTFLFTFVLPWPCYWLMTAVVDEEGVVGDVAAIFMTSTLWEDAVISLGTALIFLVIGLILQFWQHQRPFQNWWPVVLAFPVIWGLLLPEFLLRQSPLFGWILFGTAIPLVFCVHWMVVVAAREAS